jgi:hypothetical protein
MRRAPSCTGEQIEYERRTSWPSIAARSVGCWPASNRNCDAKSAGTLKVSATASRLALTWASLSGWNLDISAA